MDTRLQSGSSTFKTSELRFRVIIENYWTMVDMFVPLTAHISRSLDTILHPPSLQTSSGPTTTCTQPSVLNYSLYLIYDSDLSDSHVIPGLMHKCYLAESTYYGVCEHLEISGDLTVLLREWNSVQTIWFWKTIAAIYLL